jgi:hypothetical protein
VAVFVNGFSFLHTQADTTLATHPHRRTLHEHEALQIRRKRGVAPLARLDVDGLAGD